MSRTVRGGRLETRTARLKLAPQSKPYWNSTAKPGLHLGYRRLAKRNGTWIARTYQGREGTYILRAFAQADDYSDSDGDAVLSYFEAAQRIAGAAPPVRHTPAAYTAADAVRDYLDYIARHKKSITDARSRLITYVLPYFGDRPLANLKPADFDSWLKWTYEHDPRANAPKRKRAPSSPSEQARRRKSTVNKVIGYWLAALTRAFEQGHIERHDAWSRVRKFRGVESARIARLTADEARRLTNASAPDFRQLLEVALLTGCRYGELIAFTARDFDAGSGTMLVAESKSGKPRRVPLTEEGQRLLTALTAGKAPEAAVLTRADGTPWSANEQMKPLRDACAAAGIKPAITFHGLRHTVASLLVERGVPLAFVAEVLGHSDTRMVSRHYAHLAPNVVHEAIRAGLPTFNVQVDDKVRKLHP